MQEQYGLLVSREHGRLSRLDDAFALHCRHIAHHDGERLCRPVLALAQQPYGRVIAGIAGQMKTADALYRYDLTVDDGLADGRDGSTSAQGSVEQVYFGTAVVAADRLGIIAAVVRRRILGMAGFAHREFAHAGPLAVVGHGFEDGQARSAGCAVYEGMQVAAVVRIVELGPAFIAGRYIR